MVHHPSPKQAWTLYRQLPPLFAQLYIVDPAQMWDRRHDRKAKTDHLDALRLAQALARGELTGRGWIPDDQTKDMRVPGRAKIRVSRWVTKLTNELGSLLRSWGVALPKSLLLEAGERLLAEVELPAPSQQVLTLWKDLWERLRPIERELEPAVAAEAQAHPVCRQLMTAPQIGALTALVVRAEVGDIARFGQPQSLVSYIGLAPGVFQSGERCHYGPLPAAGNRWLRNVLVLRANRVAWKMAHLLWQLLSRGQSWQEELLAIANPTR